MANIVLTWEGEEYTIPEKQAFQVGEDVEDILTVYDLISMGSSVKFRKLAKCFGIMLRHAGCKVSDSQVHSKMMEQVKSGGEDVVAQNALFALMAVLMDGAPEDEGGDTPEKQDAS